MQNILDVTILALQILETVYVIKKNLTSKSADTMEVIVSTLIVDTQVVMSVIRCIRSVTATAMRVHFRIMEKCSVNMMAETVTNLVIKYSILSVISMFSIQTVTQKNQIELEMANVVEITTLKHVHGMEEIVWN